MLRFDDVALRRGPLLLLDHMTVSLHAGWRVGISGRNGAGKSSLLALVAGELSPDAGNFERPRGWTMAYVRQEVAALDVSALDFVLDGDVELREIERELAEAEAAHDGMRQAHLHQRLLEVDGYSARARAGALLHGLGFANGDETRSVRDFSGGWRMRLNLAQALMCRSDLLLLDEPTNHLDAETTAWLEKHLRAYKGSVLLITHDRYFLDNVTGWILELDRGRGIPYEGNYTAYLEAKAKRLKQEGREDDARQKAITREREWIASSPKARQTKSKARIKAFEDLLEQANSRRPTDTQIVIPHGERLGNVVIEVEGLNKGFGDELLIENLSLLLVP